MLRHAGYDGNVDLSIAGGEVGCDKRERERKKNEGNIRKERTERRRKEERSWMKIKMWSEEEIKW